MVMTSLVVSAALAASAAGLATGASPAGSNANPIKATTSASKGFAPKRVVAKPSARVFFKNVDRAPHNAVHDAVTGKPKFKSGKLTTGNFSLRAPAATGSYSYICAVHAFMRGTLVVKK